MTNPKTVTVELNTEVPPQSILSSLNTLLADAANVGLGFGTPTVLVEFKLSIEEVPV